MNFRLADNRDRRGRMRTEFSCYRCIAGRRWCLDARPVRFESLIEHVLLSSYLKNSAHLSEGCRQRPATIEIFGPSLVGPPERPVRDKTAKKLAEDVSQRHMHSTDQRQNEPTVDLDHTCPSIGRCWGDASVTDH